MVGPNAVENVGYAQEEVFEVSCRLVAENLGRADAFFFCLPCLHFVGGEATVGDGFGELVHLRCVGIGEVCVG